MAFNDYSIFEGNIDMDKGLKNYKKIEFKEAEFSVPPSICGKTFRGLCFFESYGES